MPVGKNASDSTPPTLTTYYDAQKYFISLRLERMLSGSSATSIGSLKEWTQRHTLEAPGTGGSGTSFDPLLPSPAARKPRFMASNDLRGRLRGHLGPQTVHSGPFSLEEKAPRTSRMASALDATVLDY